MSTQLVPAKPTLIPLEQRIKAKVARHRTIPAAPPPGTRLTVTVEDAAQLLGLAPTTVRTMIGEGTLAALHFGHRLVVPMAGITELIEEATARAAAVRQGARRHGTHTDKTRKYRGNG